MKKTTYIFLFVVLGLLLQFIIHAVGEWVVIFLLLVDFQKFGLGLSWESWLKIHSVWTTLLIIIGLIFGFWQGRSWWVKIYESSSMKGNENPQ